MCEILMGFSTLLLAIAVVVIVFFAACFATWVYLFTEHHAVYVLRKIRTNGMRKKDLF